jgi:hypothetical protein
VALTAFASTRPLEGAVAEAALQMSHVITSPLRGISEIFLVDSAFAGEGTVKSMMHLVLSVFVFVFVFILQWLG